MNRIKTALKSFKYLPQGFVYLLSRPKLYKFLVLPVFINLLLIGTLAFASYSAINQLLQNLLTIDWLSSISFLDEILAFLSGFLAVLFTGYLSISLAVIVQSPFNGLIAEHIFEEYGVEDKVNLSGLSMAWYDIKRSLKLEIQKIVLQITILVLSLLLNLIPIVGSALFIIINFLTSYIFLNIELFDPAYSRFDYSLKRKIRQSIRYWYRDFGISLPMYFLVGIPLINFLTLPFLFTAAALLVSNKQTN